MTTVIRPTGPSTKPASPPPSPPNSASASTTDTAPSTPSSTRSPAPSPPDTTSPSPTSGRSVPSRKPPVSGGTRRPATRCPCPPTRRSGSGWRPASVKSCGAATLPRRSASGAAGSRPPRAAPGLSRIEAGHPTQETTMPDQPTALTPDMVNAIVRDMDDPRYPSKITVFCDHCGAAATGEYMVSAEMNTAERLAVARKHLVDHGGWEHTDDGDDFCPEHAGSGT